MAITVLLCYASEEESMAKRLKNHLAALIRNELITVWDRGDIEPGTEREEEIVKHLSEAQMILLLISDSFLASNFSYKIELQRAIERHERKEARVIPVILRPVDWHIPPLDKLQALPDDTKPVSSWRDRNAGFTNVAYGIRRVVEQWNAHSLPDPVEGRKALIANLDRLIETVKVQMQPPPRAMATANTLQQLSVLTPNDVTLADLVVGWQTIARAATQGEEPAISQRRVTCGELANMASQLTTVQGNLAQAVKTWEQWAKAFEHSNDPRQAAMAKTFARELAELQKAVQ